MQRPDVYAGLESDIPNVHFHYLSVCPEFLGRKYLSFLFDYFPRGSFDTHPSNFGSTKALFKTRRYLLDRLFSTFPQRKFILVGDNSNVYVEEWILD
jgi:phosphatidate phosphatase APP1